jgi:hypothetical protein
MLELNIIFVAFLFGLASALFCSCDPGNTLPDGPPYSSRFVATVWAARMRPRWLSILGPRSLRRRKWSKRGEFGG